jgi:predicted nucleic-acid-binding Zn-ribbon protein
MRYGAACPKCTNRVLYRIAAVLDRGEENRLYPLSVATEVDSAGEPGRAVGVFEAYVCRACGFTEWYMRNPDDLDRIPAHIAKRIDPGNEGPFR